MSGVEIGSARIQPHYDIGDKILLLDSVQKESEAMVEDIQIRENQLKLLVNYIGWSSKWSEWIPVHSKRILKRLQSKIINKLMNEQGMHNDPNNKHNQLLFDSIVQSLPHNPPLTNIYQRFGRIRKIEENPNSFELTQVLVELEGNKLGEQLFIWFPVKDLKLWYEKSHESTNNLARINTPNTIKYGANAAYAYSTGLYTSPHKLLLSTTQTQTQLIAKLAQQINQHYIKQCINTQNTILPIHKTLSNSLDFSSIFRSLNSCNSIFQLQSIFLHQDNSSANSNSIQLLLNYYSKLLEANIRNVDSRARSELYSLSESIRKLYLNDIQSHCKQLFNSLKQSKVNILNIPTSKLSNSAEYSEIIRIEHDNSLIPYQIVTINTNVFTNATGATINSVSSSLNHCYLIEFYRDQELEICIEKVNTAYIISHSPNPSSSPSNNHNNIPRNNIDNDLAKPFIVSNPVFIRYKKLLLNSNDANSSSLTNNLSHIQFSILPYITPQLQSFHHLTQFVTGFTRILSQTIAINSAKLLNENEALCKELMDILLGFHSLLLLLVNNLNEFTLDLNTSIPIPNPIQALFYEQLIDLLLTINRETIQLKTLKLQLTQIFTSLPSSMQFNESKVPEDESMSDYNTLSNSKAIQFEKVIDSSCLVQNSNNILDLTKLFSIVIDLCNRRYNSEKVHSPLFSYYLQLLVELLLALLNYETYQPIPLQHNNSSTKHKYNTKIRSNIDNSVSPTKQYNSLISFPRQSSAPTPNTNISPKSAQNTSLFDLHAPFRIRISNEFPLLFSVEKYLILCCSSEAQRQFEFHQKQLNSTTSTNSTQCNCNFCTDYTSQIESFSTAIPLLHLHNNSRFSKTSLLIQDHDYLNNNQLVSNYRQSLVNSFNATNISPNNSTNVNQFVAAASAFASSVSALFSSQNSNNNLNLTTNNANVNINSISNNPISTSTQDIISSLNPSLILNVIWSEACSVIDRLLPVYSYRSRIFNLLLNATAAINTPRPEIAFQRDNSSVENSSNSLWSQLVSSLVRSNLHNNPISLRSEYGSIPWRTVLSSAIDAGAAGLPGPFRQVLYEISRELTGAAHENDFNSLLILTPNARSNTGDDRNKLLLNPGYISNQAEIEYRLLGMLMGMCIRSGCCLDIDLSEIVWKQLLNINLNSNDLALFDYTAYRSLQLMDSSNETLMDKAAFQEYYPDLNYCTLASDEKTLLELIPNGESINVLYENRNDYRARCIIARLNESSLQLHWLQYGLYSIISESSLSLLNWHELESRIAPEPTIDLNILKQHTTYSPKHYNIDNSYIQDFWAVLSSFTPEQLAQFLQFAWARSRLPMNNTHDNYRMQLNILDSYINPDQYLPTAETCLVKGTNICLSDYTSIPIEKLQNNSQILGYFAGNLERNIEQNNSNNELVNPELLHRAMQNGIGINNLACSKFTVDKGYRNCIKLCFIDGREIECTPEHKFAVINQSHNKHTDRIRWVRADSLQIGVDKVLFSMRGTHNPVCGPYSENWSLYTEIKTFRVNNLYNAKASYALGEILGNIIGTYSCNNSVQDEYYLTAKHKLDAEIMQQWVYDCCGKYANITTYNNMFRINIPFLQSIILKLIGHKLPNSKQIPSFLLSANCHNILKLGFLRGLFGGYANLPNNSAATDIGTQEELYAQHLDRLFGFTECVQTSSVIEFSNYFNNLKALLAEFGIDCLIIPSYKTNGWEKLIGKLLQNHNIHNNQFNCNIAHYISNNLQQINIIIDSGDQEKFIRSIGFGGCRDKTVEAEIAVTVNGIRQRLTSMINYLYTHMQTNYNHYSNNWNSCITESKLLMESIYGNIGEFVIYYDNIFNSLIDLCNGISRVDQGYILPNIAEIMKSLGVYDYSIFNNSQEKEQKQESLLIPSFNLLLVGKENLTNSKEVYDLVVPLTSSFIAQGILVHNCFFNVNLPKYSNRTILKEKLLLALTCATITS